MRICEKINYNSWATFTLALVLKLWGAVSFGPGGVNCEDRPYSAEAAVYSVRDWISQNAGEECS